MAGSYKTTGIIIGRTNYAEADRILAILTRDHGKVRAIAKGVRRVKSRSGGHLELFGEVDLMLADGRNLDVVTSARLQWYPHQLVASFESLGMAYMMGQMLERLTDEGQPHPELFELAKQALMALNEGLSGPLLELWFKLQLLNLLGYHPALGACVNCGEQSSAVSYYFSAERGGIMDDTCRPAAARPMPHATIKLWRLATSQSWEAISRIRGAGELAQASLRDCDDFYTYHIGRSFAPTA